MYQFIITIGCFDRLHNGHVLLLERLSKMCKTLIVGIHDNESIFTLKQTRDVQPLEVRVANVKTFTDHVFAIQDADPTSSLKQYWLQHSSLVLRIDQSSNKKGPKLEWTTHEAEDREHSDPKREDSFWLYPKDLPLCHHWDTHDVKVCPSRVFVRPNHQLQQFRCHCRKPYFFWQQKCVWFCAETKTLYVDNHPIPLFGVPLETIEQWMPFVFQNQIYFLCSLFPVCLVQVESTGKCRVFAGQLQKENHFGPNLVQWRKSGLFFGVVQSPDTTELTCFLLDPLTQQINYRMQVFTDKVGTLNRIDQDKVWFWDLLNQSRYYQIEDSLVESLLPNTCAFARGDDNLKFPGLDFVKDHMPILYLPYTPTVSTSLLRDPKHKYGIMNRLLEKVRQALTEHQLPFYLDCGTLLGCMREKQFILQDTDVDVTLHLSVWDQAKNIKWDKYNLVVNRCWQRFPDSYAGNIISVREPDQKLYCDIYFNPAFPKIQKVLFNGLMYPIPEHADVYLQCLYGPNWRIPSSKHADTKYHRNSGLVNSPYRPFWDPQFAIFPTKH